MTGGDLESDLPELLALVAEAAQGSETCVAIFIDEIQYLTRPELSALARASHKAAKRKLPMILVGAGMPQIAALAGEAKSYAERLFRFPAVGALEPDAARQVLLKPAARQGVAYTSEALDLILAETGGHPFFLQTWGSFAWDEAGASPITAEDVARARPDIITHLDQSFFRVRFDRCTPFEQQYLRGMAQLGPGPHQTGEVAKALGTYSAKLAAVGRSLISAGTIYSQRHGETAFTVPLFDAFMKRAMPALIPYSTTKRRTT